MARSAALNPASMPFFPGGLRGSDDERGNGPGFGSRFFTSRTGAQHLPSRFRPQSFARSRTTARSSPPQVLRKEEPLRSHATSLPLDPAKTSPYPTIEARTLREGSMLGTLGTLPEGEDNQGSEEEQALGSGHQTPGSSFYPLQQQPHGRERLPTLPFALSNLGGGGSVSGVALFPGFQQPSHSSNGPPDSNFEAQLKASPMIHDVLDRLVRCEYTTREIQRDLGDITRKVNLLVERALGVNSQPEFKDPFATNGNLANLNKPRPSIGNIAPNQAANTDDIMSISQRLNTLTSSVGQLLALQTQQMQQTTVSDARNNSIISMNAAQLDLAPNQMISPPGISGSAMIGHGLPNRPDLRPAPRQPIPPMRTLSWSPGNLDLPMRPSEQNLVRPGPADKRRSVSSLLRRDSSGVIDPQSDNWAGGASRDNGPVISKWEQLSLAPELLRSLGKFGVGPPNKIQQRALPFLLRGADIIAQAPPTQERIAAYVIPAIQVAVTNLGSRPNRGPIVIMVSTTVDQATQAQRMIRDLGGPIGVRSALGVGTTTAGNDLAQELRLLQQNMPHIICGTPQKLHALFTSPGGLIGSEVRFLVLDEVDQLIARNLHEFVFNIVKLLPPPRSRPLPANPPSVTSPTPSAASATPFTSPFEPGNPIIPPFQAAQAAGPSGRRFSSVPSPSPAESTAATAPQLIERQTALFSNTVPQDVLNLASAIHLREPVRVLVRRDGNVANPEASQGSRGLRQFYLYLAFTAGGRSDPMASTAGGGLGIIGSGRSASSAETTQAREWKLDALADLFDDVEVNQAIVHVGGMTALDSVVYKLASRGFEAIALHGDMNAASRVAALNKFRSPTSVSLRQSTTKVLVVYDVQLKITKYHMSLSSSIMICQKLWKNIPIGLIS
ncbi:hypothetical protein BDZ97DRAFT_1751116 [Flammula alnicola]|nr:hypothetical protein BDZ97DRAFT_1751116 [Flammula alnicola]